MLTLKEGSSGPEVEAWQNFLVGEGSYWLSVDGQFTWDTIQATKDFQQAAGLPVDGELGPSTFKAAVEAGFPDPTVVPDDTDVLTAAWPKKPDSLKSLSFMERAKIFGTFAFEAAPVKGNAEAVKITDGWDKKNIVPVEIPQLKGTPGCPNGIVLFHKLGAKQLKSLWAAWEAAGLLPLVKTFDGGWVARYIRGSTKSLSNHSYGTAFDINYKWNMLGHVPALVGKDGSVRKLVEIAVEHGFFWGGWFPPSRYDGMHFELYKLIP